MRTYGPIQSQRAAGRTTITPWRDNGHLTKIRQRRSQCPQARSKITIIIGNEYFHKLSIFYTERAL
jgi:hypothetical protein